MRIPKPGRPSHHNNIQMLISRGRSKWSLLAWNDVKLHEEDNKSREAALARLTEDQIGNNTTRGTTPGLINPALGEKGGRIPNILPKRKSSGPRAAGKGHGGGNTQEKYKDKESTRAKEKVSN